MRTRQIEIQLSAIAQAADRRNRPTIAIAIGVAFMLGALGYTIATLWNMNSQGSRLLAAERTGERVASRIADIQLERDSRPDYAAMFPEKTRYPVSVVDEANRVWPDRTWTFGQIGQEKPTRGVQLIENLNRTGVRLAIRNEPLEPILELAERIVNGPEEQFGKSFIALLELRPVPSDDTWLTTIEIDRYEFRRPR